MPEGAELGICWSHPKAPEPWNRNLVPLVPALHPRGGGSPQPAAAVPITPRPITPKGATTP